MKRNYYIFKSGELKRKDNSIVLKLSNDEHRYIPVKDVDSFYFFGELSFNTKFFNFLSQEGIVAHFFNYYGFYTGSFYPKETLNSGMLVVKQVEFYLDKEKRLKLAKEILYASAYNIRHNLKYYNTRGRNLEESIARIERLMKNFDNANSIPELMALEGNIREEYYKCFGEIILQEIEFEKRVFHPPDNMVNTLLSFMNSLVYTTVLSEIYKTQLNPLISYLHEPGTRRFSLCLDIAEIFKPLLGDRLIFALLNKRQIKEDDFDKELNFLYLKEKSRKIIIQEFDERLKTTVKHRKLKRSISYRHLIRLELYKLIKHLLGEEEYKGFRIWW